MEAKICTIAPLCVSLHLFLLWWRHGSRGRMLTLCFCITIFLLFFFFASSYGKMAADPLQYQAAIRLLQRQWRTVHNQYCGSEKWIMLSPPPLFISLWYASLGQLLYGSTTSSPSSLSLCMLLCFYLECMIHGCAPYKIGLVCVVPSTPPDPLPPRLPPSSCRLVFFDTGTAALISQR